MQFPTVNTFVAMLTIVDLTSAHMFVISPKPYAAAGDKGPLKSDGSNFPCHGIANTGPVDNQWPAGSTQQLAFNGTAVHAGGSCQISVTTDKNPTASSVFKVLHSIEGGCPLAPKPPLVGNYVEGTVPDLGSYDFKVPKDLPNGDVVVAATWFNNVGNREFYMFCASVSILGGAEDASALDALPKMAMANIPQAGGCRTPDNMDYIFEDPGTSVVRLGLGKFAPLCGGAVIPGPGAPPANPGIPPANAGIPSPPAPAVPSVSQAPAPSNGTAKVTSTILQNITVTASSGPESTSSAQQGADMASPPAAKPSPQVSQAVPSPAAPVPNNGAAPTCSPDGAVVCSADGTKFALCNFGKVVFQPLAAGTTCKDGKVLKRDEYASSLKTVYT